MKTAIITGAARGIGAATAKLFAEKGFNVCVNYVRSEEKAQALARALPSAVAIKADVSIKEEARALIDTAVETFGGIDVLVNNAGIALPQKLVTDVSDEEFNEIFSTNIKGTHNAVSAALPYMISRKSGSIVNLASLWGVRGGSCEAVYTSSKAAVIGYTKALAAEVGPSGIRVNCVAPGVIKTDMLDALPSEVLPQLAEETPLRRLGRPEDIAAAVSYLASDDASFVTGQVLTVDGGFIL